MTKVPKYKGLRLFIVSILLYYMLASPVIGILFSTNSPKLFPSQAVDSVKINESDSALKVIKETGLVSDSLETKVDFKKKGNGTKIDTLRNNSNDVKVNLNEVNKANNITGSEKLFLNCLLISFILGFVFVLPNKIFFRRKRKKRSIPPKIEIYVRKTILYSPTIMASIIALPFISQNINLIYHHFIAHSYTEDFQRKMSLQYWAIFILAGLLTVAFVYSWQKHNVQIKYIQHIFSKEELKKRIFKRKSGKIKNRLLLTSFITTLLPLSIVVSYILMSITSISDLQLYHPSHGELKIIFGEYFNIFKSNNGQELLDKFNFYYINVVNTILLFFGIGSGIVVTVIYVVFFVRWTNADIIYPVKELLLNMQKTTAGQLENYSLVRTNDELGNLSENYNIMTSKLNEYITHIDQMNAELEQKVKERTAEIQSQKEEIEAQRDEVESQRDEIERQRDYVVEQRDLIISQKKAITDSIEYAAHIQSAILPPEKEIDKILQEYFIYNKPRDIVSGDFYWAHKIKKKGQNKVIVVVADSTGHGVPGALMSMLGITLLKEIVVKKEIYTPSEILDNLKEGVVNALHQTPDFGKSKDGIDISVCLVDFEKKTLEFAGAYNSVYIVRKLKPEDEFELLSKNLDVKVRLDKFEDNLLYEIKADKNPIGISQKTPESYSLNRFNLEENDVIYLFSDGFADQFGGRQRLKYLYSRFKILLAKVSSLPMQKQYESIDNELKNWKGAEKQIDDILVIGFSIK